MWPSVRPILLNVLLQKMLIVEVGRSLVLFLRQGFPMVRLATILERSVHLYLSSAEHKGCVPHLLNMSMISSHSLQTPRGNAEDPSRTTCVLGKCSANWWAVSSALKVSLAVWRSWILKCSLVVSLHTQSTVWSRHIWFSFILPVLCSSFFFFLFLFLDEVFWSIPFDSSIRLINVHCFYLLWRFHHEFYKLFKSGSTCYF